MPVAYHLYHENPAGQLLEHPDGYAVLRYAAGKRAPTEFQALVTHLGQLLLRRGWTCFLSDTRLMEPLSEAEKAWINTYWLDGKMHRPAQLQGAVLLATNAVTRLGVAQVQRSAPAANIRYQNFLDEAAAHAYLAGLRRN